MPNNLQLQLLMAEYQRRYGQFSQPVIDLIINYLNRGMSADAAVAKALTDTGFFQKNQEATLTITMEAAAQGARIAMKDIADPVAVKRTLLYEAWAPDKMNLSKRLHGASVEMRQTIVDTVSTSMRLNKSWLGMARDLYDGYGSGKVINQAELPEYLEWLVRQSRRVLAGDTSAIKRYQAAVREAESQTNKLASHDAPTNALKAAYNQLLDATKQLSEKAIDKAVHLAVEEKSRYLAERIARTEISAAWGDGFLARYQKDSDVIAFRWTLSSRHPYFDICDIHAAVNLYGLGPGVYPKNKFPRRPAHPHCMCLIEPVYVGELHEDPEVECRMLANAKFDPRAMSKLLDSLSKDKQLQLFGSDGLDLWCRGRDWHKLCGGWENASLGESRFTAKDLISGSEDKAFSGLITPEKTFGIEVKLTGYSLNKDHPKGKDKAVAFEQALGYTLNSWKELQNKIFEGLQKYPATSAGTTPVTNNPKYRVIMAIDGPNGKTANVLTVWEQVEGRFRMVNAYVSKRKTF